MTITELTHDQRIALVALMKSVAMADGVVGDGDQREIAAVSEAFGDDEYRRLLDEADRQFASVDALKVFLANVSDPAAREAIFGTVWEECQQEPIIDHAESELLRWLATTWGISPPTAETE